MQRVIFIGFIIGLIAGVIATITVVGLAFVLSDYTCDHREDWWNEDE